MGGLTKVVGILDAERPWDHDGLAQDIGQHNAEAGQGLGSCTIFANAAEGDLQQCHFSAKQRKQAEGCQARDIQACRTTSVDVSRA